MKSLSRMQFALLGQYIAPATKVSPDAANAILRFQSALEFAGWSKAEARVEIRRLGSKPQPQNGTQ